MNTILCITASVLILSLGFVSGSQANSMARSGFGTYDTTRLIGLTVKARDGVELGQIVGLVVDSSGHVDFAIVNQSTFKTGFADFRGRLVVVPFGTLMISKGQSNTISVVFKADKERFYEGPNLGDKNLSDLKQAASVDRYYGIQPYWTEGGHMSGQMMKHSTSGSTSYQKPLWPNPGLTN